MVVSNIKTFYFFKGEETTTHGYTRIYGGSGIEPFSHKAFETRIEHTTHTELLGKLCALLPRGCLKDVWETVGGVHVYYNEASSYSRIKDGATLLVLFMFYGTRPVHRPDAIAREQITGPEPAVSI